MNPDDLLDRLSADMSHRRRWTPQRLLLAGVGIALLIATILSYLLLAQEPDASVIRIAEPLFLLKMAFVLSIVFSALSIVRDLSSPGRKVGWQALVMVAPFLIIAVVSAEEMLGTHSTGWEHELAHASIATCLWQIGLLALPAFAVLTAIVRSLAPVNLARTGLYLGLLSGAIGAFGYAFHCHENFVTLVAVSYSLAIVQMGLLGACLGPRLLRWS